MHCLRKLAKQSWIPYNSNMLFPDTQSKSRYCQLYKIILYSTPTIFFTYYIHTEKYSPKIYVVNFRTHISSSQSEERTMVFTRERNDTSNQKRQNSPLLLQLAAPLRTHSTRKVVLIQRVFLAKKSVKHLGNGVE